MVVKMIKITSGEMSAIKDELDNIAKQLIELRIYLERIEISDDGG